MVYLLPASFILPGLPGGNTLKSWGDGPHLTELDANSPEARGAKAEAERLRLDKLENHIPTKEEQLALQKADEEYVQRMHAPEETDLPDDKGRLTLGASTLAEEPLRPEQITYQQSLTAVSLHLFTQLIALRFTESSYLPLKGQAGELRLRLERLPDDKLIIRTETGDITVQVRSEPTSALSDKDIKAACNEAYTQYALRQLAAREA